jgi:hypothetical protein
MGYVQKAFFSSFRYGLVRNCNFTSKDLVQNAKMKHIQTWLIVEIFTNKMKFPLYKLILIHN